MTAARIANVLLSSRCGLLVQRAVSVDVVAVAHQVSEESSLIIVYLTIAELLPAAIVVLVFGSWSDATGRRKFLMWLPCVGNALYALGFLLPWYISAADIDRSSTMTLFVVGSLASGLSGAVPGFLSGNASYISDTDSPRRRTLRLAVVELSIGGTFAVASLVNGFWIGASSEKPNFEQPLWFIFVCSLVPFVVIMFLVREPASELGQASDAPAVDSGTMTYFRFKNFRGIRRAFGCATYPQRKLWAIIVAFEVYVFVQQGQERTLVMFLQTSPLRCGSVEIGFQLFVMYGLASLGSWPGVPLAQRVITDLGIAAVAMVSKMIGSLLLVAASNGAVVYACELHGCPQGTARGGTCPPLENVQGRLFSDPTFWFAQQTKSLPCDMFHRLKTLSNCDCGRDSARELIG